jgi:hypothetical protein
MRSLFASAAVISDRSQGRISALADRLGSGIAQTKAPGLLSDRLGSFTRHPDAGSLAPGDGAKAGLIAAIDEQREAISDCGTERDQQTGAMVRQVEDGAFK